MLLTSLLSIIITPIACFNDLTLEEIATPATQRSFDFSPKLQWNNFFNFPTSFLNNVICVGEWVNPPKKLNKPYSITIPSVDEIKNHLKLALTASCVSKQTTGWQCNMTCEDYKELEILNKSDNDILATIGMNEKTKEIIISHRGAIEWMNWVLNLSFDMINMANTNSQVQVHRGFLTAYHSNSEGVIQTLMKFLTDGKYKDYSVVFTGHSMGAAIATLNAIDLGPLLESLGVKYKLFTYNGPRIGNKAFVDYATSLDFPMARYVFKKDLVNHFPPRGFGFVHLPAEVYTSPFEEGEDVIICNQEWDEDPSCSYSAKTQLIPEHHLTAFNIKLSTICNKIV